MSPRAGVMVAGAAAILMVAAAPRAAAQPIASADGLERWVANVKTHQPGRADRAAREIASLSYAARRELNPSMEAFLHRLGGWRGQARDDGARKVAGLARSVEEDPGVAKFLMRAAVLHSDAFIFADRFPVPPDDGPPPAPAGTARRLQPPPLLFNERLVLTRDGQITGEAITSWQLPFARSLLVLLPGDRFVREWYHAVAAYLFANGMLGDATAHLRRAAQDLPDDARLVFDRASYAETLGLPIYQLVSDSSRPGFVAQIPGEDHTNGEAERLYRRALEIDGTYVEARVRLARLLNHRGQHEEAAVEIGRAIESKPSGVIAFYAHLVAGRVASTRGRYDEALQQYRGALALFDHAQSALLGASQAALMNADVSQALVPLTALDGESVPYEADPWRDYQLGAGRDVNALMADLWARVAGPAQ